MAELSLKGPTHKDEEFGHTKKSAFCHMSLPPCISGKFAISVCEIKNKTKQKILFLSSILGREKTKTTKNKTAQKQTNKKKSPNKTKKTPTTLLSIIMYNKKKFIKTLTLLTAILLL